MSEKEDIKKTLQIGKILIWVGTPIGLLAPLIFTLESGYFDFTKSGDIGDTMGGISAPFINTLAAILVFLALKAQIQQNIIVQNQIDQQKIEKNLEKESNQLHHYYSNLKGSIDGFEFSTLDTWDIGDDKNTIVRGSEAIYKLFQEYICSHHGVDDDLKSNPKITELLSMLEICDKLLELIKNSKVDDRETLWTLTSHQFTYRIFPRLHDEYPDKIDTYFCNDCNKDHGFPERISNLIKNIHGKINNGL